MPYAAFAVNLSAAHSAWPDMEDMLISDNPAALAIQSLVAEIVSSYVKKNQIAPADMPTLINTVYQSLLAAGKAPEPVQNRTPAVPVRQSVRPNYVVCLECGRLAKMLRK